MPLSNHLSKLKTDFAGATPKLHEKAAKESTGIKLIIKSEDLAELAMPLKLVEMCKVKGGPAPTEVKRALAQKEKQLLTTKSNISKIDKELEEAENKLESIIQSFLPVNKSKNTTFKNST